LDLGADAGYLAEMYNFIDATVLVKKRGVEIADFDQMSEDDLKQLEQLGRNVITNVHDEVKETPRIVAVSTSPAVQAPLVCTCQGILCPEKHSPGDRSIALKSYHAQLLAMMDADMKQMRQKSFSRDDVNGLLKRVLLAMNGEPVQIQASPPDESEKKPKFKPFNKRR